MRTRNNIVVAGILAAAVGGLLIADFVPPSVLAMRAGVTVAKASVSPTDLTMQAPHNLPVQQYDSH